MTLRVFPTLQLSRFGFCPSKGRTKHRCRRSSDIIPPFRSPKRGPSIRLGPTREYTPSQTCPWGSLQDLPAAHGPGQGKLVGVLQVAPERQPVGGTRDLHSQRRDHPLEVGRGGLT